ncbi:protein of unknown function [Georgfuchsia toluolica]|uniref:Uncharacterized protein n=1 Tax=Georgfuchsia toluolica TaxID=424218 RepID=A0A916N9M2_9PROT|nr:protein of unknown function [Georgfuchsia toluolica]
MYKAILRNIGYVVKSLSWIAMSAYAFVTIIRKCHSLDVSLYTLL